MVVKDRGRVDARYDIISGTAAEDDQVFQVLVGKHESLPGDICN